MRLLSEKHIFEENMPETVSRADFQRLNDKVDKFEHKLDNIDRNLSMIARSVENSDRKYLTPSSHSSDYDSERPKGRSRLNIPRNAEDELWIRKELSKKSLEDLHSVEFFQGIIKNETCKKFNFLMDIR
jgi:hypothetical protein